MTLKEYIFELKERLLLPHGLYDSGAISDHNDGFQTNEMLTRDIYNAISHVIREAKLFIKSMDMALVANQYEYGYPINCLKIHSITHTYSGTVTPLQYRDYTAFIDGFNATHTGTTPNRWSLLETKAQVHRFWQSDDADYTTTSAITSSTGLNHLYDQYANFGTTENGEYPEEDDVVWSDTDGSYANVRYFEMETAVTTVTASETSQVTYYTTARVVTAGDLSSVNEGHLVYNSTDTSWGFCTQVNTSEGIIYVDKWHGGTNGYPSLNDSVKIGIANHIYFKTLNPFTTRAFRNGVDNTPTAEDVYRLQDKFETAPVIVIAPVPASTDTTGTESLTLWYSAKPTTMQQDNDPAPIDDVWSDYILDYAFILAIKRQPDRLGEAESLELVFNNKIADMKRDHGLAQLGEAHNIYHNINPAGSSMSGVELFVSY
jgi:hypothetical protein